MVAPTVQEFYAVNHRGTAFGVVDAVHPKPHSGSDFNGWPLGTRIPAFAAGTVAAKGSSPGNFGFWVTVDIGGGYFAHYCHQATAGGSPAVGAPVEVGSDVGPLGSTGYSTGPHLHAMVSRATNPDRYFGVTNPMPWIDKVLAQPEGDIEMRLIRHPNGTITTIGETTYQHHSLASYPADAAAYGAFVQLDDATYNRAIANTQVRLAYLKAQIAGTPGSAVDPAAIAAKVEQTLADDFQRLSDQITELSSAVANLDVATDLVGVRQVVREELSKLTLAQIV